ncbi:MAG TPA: glycosyltransferase family 4 protein [Lacibacter sp.]|nr:glycosyltransferase family 4 protein [Lacibacter sp.]
MHKERILFILHLPPPVHGAGVVGKQIRDSLLINQSFDTDYINLSTSNTISSVEKLNFHKLVALLSIAFKILSHLIRKNYDLCYMTLTTSGPGFYKDLFIVALLKLFRKRIIYHFHNKGVKEHNHYLNKWLYRFAFHNTCAIVLSPRLVPDLLHYFDKDHLYICPNGIPELPSSGSRPGNKQDGGGSAEPVRFLFLSNMLEEKGVFVLLEACRLLRNSTRTPFTCTFAGSWSDVTEEEFRGKVEEAGLTSCVKATGAVYGADKEALFRQADAFIFPTHYHNECFPLVLLEAMQHRLPVISTFEGGIPDMVVEEQTGLLVPPRDPLALAGKLAELLGDASLRRKMGEAGYERYHEMYTIAEFEKQLHSILAKAAYRPAAQLYFM